MGYPLASQVLAGVVFGASNELTGTLVVPTAAQVELGVDYGVGGTASHGTLRVPLATQVRNGVSFGGADALTGTLTVPSANKVIAGWAYGAAGAEFVGTYNVTLPSVSQVLAGVSFGTGQTGNVVLPAPESVEYGIHYGVSNGAVGTFTGPGNSIPTTGQIVDAILNAALPASRVEGSVGEALMAARAGVFGDRATVGSTLRYYGPDGVTLIKTMNVNDVTNPTTITNGD